MPKVDTGKSFSQYLSWLARLGKSWRWIFALLIGLGKAKKYMYGLYYWLSMKARDR